MSARSTVPQRCDRTNLALSNGVLRLGSVLLGSRRLGGQLGQEPGRSPCSCCSLRRTSLNGRAALDTDEQEAEAEADPRAEEQHALGQKRAFRIAATGQMMKGRTVRTSCPASQWQRKQGAWRERKPPEQPRKRQRRNQEERTWQMRRPGPRSRKWMMTGRAEPVEEAAAKAAGQMSSAVACTRMATISTTEPRLVVGACVRVVLLPCALLLAPA